MRIFNAVLSYFVSKLYLKVTCFRSFAFILKLIWFVFFVFLFKMNLDYYYFLSCVTPGNRCSLPCCKEFLIGQFLCHRVSVWATRKCILKKDKKNNNKRIKKKKSAISAPTLVCQFNELRVR